jgi:hypothetical protein
MLSSIHRKMALGIGFLGSWKTHLYRLGHASSTHLSYFFFIHSNSTFWRSWIIQWKYQEFWTPLYSTAASQS